MNVASYQKGLALALLAPLLYSIRSAIIKSMPQTDVPLVVFSHFFLGFFFLLPLAIKHRKKLSTQCFPLYFLRGILVMLAIYCSVYGVRHLALLDVALMENTFSLFVPLIIWAWYRKSLSLYSWILLMLGFFSVFLLLKPQLNIFHIAALASLGSAFAAAISWVLVNSFSKTEHPVTILFYFYVCGGIATLFPLCYFWKGVESIPSNWWPFFLMAFLGVLYQHTMNRAFSLIQPHIVGNLSYFSVLANAILGWLIWQEKMNLMQLLGGVLLIGVGILIKKQTKQSTQQKQNIMYDT